MTTEREHRSGGFLASLFGAAGISSDDEDGDDSNGQHLPSVWIARWFSDTSDDDGRGFGPSPSNSCRDGKKFQRSGSPM